MNEQSPSRQWIEMTPMPVFNQTRTFLPVHRTQGKNTQNRFELDNQGSNMYQTTQEQQPIEQKYIYGTNILTGQVQTTFMKFIEQFETRTEQDGIQEFVYKDKMRDIDLDIIPNNLFQIDGCHIKEFDSELYNQLRYFPSTIITIFDQSLKKIYQRGYIGQFRDDEQEFKKKINHLQQLMVSIVNLPNTTFIRNFSQNYINKLISFKGIVIRCSDIYPEMKIATFKCVNPECFHQEQVPLENAKVQQPLQCFNCKQRETYELIHNFCHFTDKQYIKIQQLPENVLEGQTPSSSSIICYDSSVNSMRPGDRVQIVGIYRCQPRKVTRSKLSIETVFSTYTDLISFKIIEENRFKASLEDAKTHFSQEQKYQFFAIANQPNVIDNLVESFAPSIYGHQSIKKGLLSQIFGGTHKQFERRGRFRSDINVCLVGDPSTAKQQFLKQVYQIAPRGIYTSGKGSSAVGLTANVRKDPQTRQFILQSGALVLSDLGICCIDQFDKMDTNSKLVLLEAMEQQTISVAKAGIVCQLNSRTSILSAANPINSKYNPKQTVVENINLPPALLSRFDLIYIILDLPNKEMDEKLAKHVLSIFSKKQNVQNRQAKISQKIFSNYITYAKQNVQPKLTKESGAKLIEYYKQMRRKGQNTKTVSATVRQLQSLIRISQSFAKMKLSKIVDVSDVTMAYELIKQALKQSAIDPTTGIIDMDLIVTGTSAASRKRVEYIFEICKQLFKANQSQYCGRKIIFGDFYGNICAKYNHDNLNQLEAKPREEDVLQAFQKLEKEGTIQIFGYDKRNKPTIKYTPIDQKNF